MADNIQFRVDAVLGDTTRLQQQINNLRTNLNLTINNTQALQSIRQVQQQINNLRNSMTNMNLNIGGSGGRGSSDGRSPNNNANVGQPLVANQQFQTSAQSVNSIQGIIDNLNTQINGTVSKLRLCTDETGRIVGGTAEITQGATTWTRNIEQARDAQGQIIEGQYRLTEQGRVAVDNTKKYNGALTQQIKMQFKQYAVYYAVSSVIRGIADGISNCVSYAIDLDSTMTNIRVVTMDTKEATKDLLKTYNQLGQELGANTLDIAEGAVDWLRQGYSESDTTELVKNSTILSKLALIDNAQATEYLTSALKGYKLEAKDAIGVIDQLVSIDLEAATSAGDMAEAMSRTANMAKTTGFEMNELLGMIATMSEVTQNSASTIGNSVKTILSRMSNVKAGLDDFEGEALNDVEKTLNRVGIALRDNQGNWYDFYDVLDEVASKWDSFSDVQQSQITTALGGTRQRENILVALENWDKVKQYASTGADSAGTAMEKYDIVLESVSAKQKQLNAKVQEFYNNIFNSGLISGLLEVGKGFMDVMNWCDGLLGKVVLLTTAFIVLNTVWTTMKTTTLITNLVSLLKTIWTVVAGTVTLNGAFLNLGTSGIGALLLSIPKAIIGLISLTAQFGWAEVSALGLKGALDLLNINPVMLALSALIAVVAGGIALFNHFNPSLEEHQKRLAEAKQEYIDSTNRLKELNDEFGTVQEKIKKLERRKGDLTLIEENELKLLKDQSRELQRQIDLEEVKNKQANKSKNKEFVNTMRATDSESYVFDQFETYQKYINDLEVLEKQYKEGRISESEYKSKTDTIRTAMDDIASYLQDQYDILAEASEGIEYIPNPQTSDEEALNLLLDYVNEFKDKYIASLGDIEQITNLWYDIFTRDKFKEAGEALQELADKGELTASKLVELFTGKGNEKIKELINYLISLGLIKFDSDFIDKYDKDLDGVISTTEASEASTEDLTKAFGGLANQIANVGEVAKDTAGGISKLTYADAIKAVKDEVEILATARKEMSETGYLTADTVLKLQEEFGDLSQYLTLTANGYKISKAGLDALNSSMMQTYAVALAEAKTAALNVLDQEHKKALSYAQTTAEIIKQLEAQRALALATKAESELWDKKGGNYPAGYKNYKGSYNGTTVAEYDKLISDLKNSQNNYNVVKNTINSLYADKSKSSSGSSSSSSSKQWWETQLETLKDQLEYNEISMDTYINGIENILGKLKKGTDAWNEVNKELQEAKLENVENQYDRGEITIDQYIEKLTELRKAYKEGTEGYKELTETINDAKYDKFSSQYDRGEITIDQYIEKLRSLQEQYKQGSEEYKKLADEIDEIKLEKTEKYLDKLQDRLDKLDQKIDELGEVNTDKESVKYAQLLSQKYEQVQENIASIKEQLKDTNLTEEQREALQEELNDLLKEEVDIRDEIEDQVKTYYENQKEQAEKQAELKKKQTLYNKEVELYGEQGKELFEYYTNKEIEALEAKKDALDENNEREQLENDILEARLKLQNALNSKTTKILKKQSDGTWQYEYSANMVEVKNAQEELANAEKALEEYDLQSQIDELNKNMQNLADQYADAEFWAEREYEQTMNAIDKAYGDIDSLVEKWMDEYGDSTTELVTSYQSLVSANNKLEQSLVNLESAIESKYETVGTNKVSTKDGVKSFDTGGKIVGNGLILAHDKERVLTTQQNLYFEQLISKLPQLLKAVDVTKFGGYVSSKTFGSRVSADKVNSTVIHNVNCNFPNINSTDGLQQAILQLPRLALQNK